MKLELKKVLDYVARNIIWIALIVAGLFLLSWDISIISTLLICIAVEGLALGLSGLSLYVYTKIDFIEFIMKGEDKKLSGTERYSMMVLLGQIFLGVHILIGLVILGVYIAQFAN